MKRENQGIYLRNIFNDASGLQRAYKESLDNN